MQWVGPDNQIWASLGADRASEGGRRRKVAASTPTAEIEILRGRLAELLYRRCVGVSEDVQAQGGKGVEFVFGRTVSRIEQDGDGVTVHFARGLSGEEEGEGEARRFDLVAGADGLQSTTRKLIWGEEGEGDRLYNLNFYNAFFSMPKGPTDTMWRRWYHAPGRRGIMIRPDQQRGRTTVFLGVLSETDERFASLCGGGGGGGKKKRRKSTNVQAQKDLIREYFQDAGWESERVLQGMMETDDFYYDMVAQVKMEHFSKGRVVLLGDAGYVFPIHYLLIHSRIAIDLTKRKKKIQPTRYCASPFSGMGTTLALTGAYNLAGALLQHPDDLNKAFTAYEDKMKPTIVKAQKLAPGMPRLFHPETAWGVWVLNMFVYLIDVSGVASLMFKLGAGPPANHIPVDELGIGDLPEMLEG